MILTSLVLGSMLAMSVRHANLASTFAESLASSNSHLPMGRQTASISIISQWIPSKLFPADTPSQVGQGYYPCFTGGELQDRDKV